MRVAAITLLCALAVGLGCSKSKNPASDAAPSSSAAGLQGDAGDDDDVRPVYPVEGVVPHPLAVALCDALHELPEKKRAACCSQPARTVPTSECVRMASVAIASKAVVITDASIAACRAAMEQSHSGCDWVGPFPPPVPAPCLAIITGTVKESARCRSSLECEGSLRCQGVGPTRAGKCAPPRPDGAACFGSVDPLAAVTRQDDVDATHRECAGFCDRIKCAPLVAEGGACTSARECGPGRVCETGGPAKKAGADAGGGGTCVARALAKIVARKAAGASCERDFDCLGGCIKADGGAKGVCGQKCDVR